MITSTCRINKSNGQKILTVPKNCNIGDEDLVLLTKIEDPTQMNNDKEVEKDGTRSARYDRRIGYDSGPRTTGE